MPTRSAEAIWNGPLMTGNGSLKVASGALTVPYDWKSRAESGATTSPEELIAAAHAGCFSMALSHILGGAGHPPTKIETKAIVSFEKQGDGFAITKIALTTVGTVPGLDEAGFKTFADMAKAGCPVSKALSAVPISLDAKLG